MILVILLLQIIVIVVVFLFMVNKQLSLIRKYNFIYLILNIEIIKKDIIYNDSILQLLFKITIY